MENCSIGVTSCVRVAFPDVEFRNDILIPTPQLKYPQDGEVSCKELQDGNTQICLCWYNSVGANVYLLQLSTDSNFQLPNVNLSLIHI